MNISQMLPLTRRVAGPVVALAVTGCALLGMVGTASAATPPPAAAVAAVVPAVAATPSQVVDKGVFSVQETITNNTDVDWTWNPQNTKEGYDNHWQQRPQQTLRAHTKEVVSGYTDDYIDGESLQVGYTMPDGDYVLSDDELQNGDNPTLGGVRTGIFTQNPATLPSSQEPTRDPAWTSVADAGSGYHTDSSFTVSPAS